MTSGRCIQLSVGCDQIRLINEQLKIQVHQLIKAQSKFQAVRMDGYLINEAKSQLLLINGIYLVNDSFELYQLVNNQLSIKSRIFAELLCTL